MRAGLMASRVRRAGGCPGKARSGRSAAGRKPKWGSGCARLAGGGVGRRGRVRGECGARRGGNGIVLCGPGRGLGAAELTRREAFVVALEDASDMENTAQNLFAGGNVDFALCSEHILNVKRAEH